MKPVAAVVVVTGVLLVLGGLAFVLYEAGQSDEAPDGPGGSVLGTGRRGPRTKLLPPPPAPSLPPDRVRAPLAKKSDEKARFDFKGHELLGVRNWKVIADAYAEINAREHEMKMTGVAPPLDSKEAEKLSATMRHYQTVAFEMPDGMEFAPKADLIEHPAFASNLIAALVARARMPLSADQEKRLHEIARKAVEEVDEYDAKTYDGEDGTFVIDHIIERAEIIERFFAGVWSTLTNDQAEAVLPSEYRNRTRENFSSGVVLRRLITPQAYSSFEDLVDGVTERLSVQFEWRDRKADLRPFVEAWAKSLSLEPFDELEKKFFLKTRRIFADARRMSALYHALPEGMVLSSEDALKVRQTGAAFIPTPK